VTSRPEFATDYNHLRHKVAGFNVHGEVRVADQVGRTAGRIDLAHTVELTNSNIYRVPGVLIQDYVVFFSPSMHLQYVKSAHISFNAT
jgi:hypothetical protein